MTHPTNDPMAEDPPGYSEGPPADRTEVERAARHVERLARKNEPAGDTAGMRGPGDDQADRSEAADERNERETRPRSEP